jgi:hypothetical protein
MNRHPDDSTKVGPINIDEARRLFSASRNIESSILNPNTPATIGRFAIDRLLGESWATQAFGGHADAGAVSSVVVQRIVIPLNHTQRAAILDDLESRVREVTFALEAGLEDGAPFIAWQFQPGTAMDRYATRRELDIGERRALAHRAVDCVVELHAAGQVHGDLKPGQFIANDEGEVQLIGMNSPTVSTMDLMAIPADDRFIIRAMQYRSPATIVAPEWTATVAHDVYAMSAVVWRILAGRPTFDAEDLTRAEALERWRSNVPTMPHDIARKIGSPLHRLLQRGLSSTPAEPLRDCRELLAALATRPRWWRR